MSRKPVVPESRLKLSISYHWLIWALVITGVTSAFTGLGFGLALRFEQPTEQPSRQPLSEPVAQQRLNEWPAADWPETDWPAADWSEATAADFELPYLTPQPSRRSLSVERITSGRVPAATIPSELEYLGDIPASTADIPAETPSAMEAVDLEVSSDPAQISESPVSPSLPIDSTEEALVEASSSPDVFPASSDLSSSSASELGTNESTLSDPAPLSDPGAPPVSGSADFSLPLATPAIEVEVDESYPSS
ncbi:MAG: hypothetical protein F6K19_38645 [Cyanothece sp. SIO1E1]|nr:hypothetical protein [Cyanothece sp. SIO1E1]